MRGFPKRNIIFARDDCTTFTGNHLIHDRRYRHASRRFVKTWPVASGAVLLAYLQQTHELIGEYPMSFGCLMRIYNNIIL